MPPPQPSSPDDTSAAEDIETARRKAPWTQQFRQVVLIVLGTATFALFLYFMFLKGRGAAITYTDLFLLLATSGTLLGVNFSLDLLSALVDTAGQSNESNNDNERR